jgi:hypothetical protein
MRARERPVRIITGSGSTMYVDLPFGEVVKRYHQARRREQPTMQLDGRTVQLARIERIEEPSEDAA